MSQPDFAYMRSRIDSLVDAYDKTLFALAGGALALSVTLVDRLATEPVVDLPVLIWAWGLLALSLILLLATFLMTVSQMTEGLRLIQEGKDPSREPTLKVRLLYRFSFWASVSAGGLFVVGVALIGWFALSNL